MSTRVRPPWLSRFESMRRRYLDGAISAEEYDAWHKGVRGLDAGASQPLVLAGAKKKGVRVPCLICSTPYIRKYVNGRYCGDCRKSVKNRRDVENRRRKNEELRGALPNVVAQPSASVLSIVDDLAKRELRAQGSVPDRSPPESFSPYGSDDGRSTYETEFGKDLDREGWYAASHRWWLDHPYWHLGLEPSAA